VVGVEISDAELHEILVGRLEVVEDAEFTRAHRIATRLGIPLASALVERVRIPWTFLLEHVAQAWGVRFLELKPSDVQPDALRILAEEYARRHRVIAVSQTGRELTVAMCNPRDRVVLDEIQRMTRRTVVPALAAESAIRRAQLLYQPDIRELLERAAGEQDADPSRTARGRADLSAPDLLDRILAYAVVVAASDVHIEPYERETLVRYRIDGLLQEVLTLEPAATPALVARIKVLSGLRIDERRSPQDGRFEATVNGLKIDLRVSSLPTHWGEKVVFRVLAKENFVLDLEDLGLTAADFEVVLRNVMRPFGMILITGPTGAGKTSTLYAMVARLGAERQNVVNISTIEDPIEYTMARVNQVPVNPTAGLSFPAGLRALLRQDPDVIMVGEIRDTETAEIAVRTALVGRLLLSTLHTNDAASAVARLLDMGVEPFLLASTLALVVGQRLVRRICVGCRESVEPDPKLMTALRRRPDFDETVHVLQREGILGTGGDPLASVRLFRGKGCRQCHGTGSRGRVGVFELFEVEDEVRALIMERQSAAALRASAVTRGMKTMLQDGLAKALLGLTTFEEVFRVAL
jgi:type II secretory ATPase GspE/PulE/Tfp pilus assembly ATPase PilB-like protein